MKIAILGFDTEGRSSYAYFLNQGHELTILDQNPDLTLPEGVQSVLGEEYLDNLDRFELIVRTAGLAPRKIFEKNPDLPPGKVTTQINEFFKASPTANIIGITGTKGKGTTSTLTVQMLQTAGKDAYLAGNIGLPALELLPQLTAESWVVLELSSFQLIDLQQSPHIAVCLMVVPEHLDWHADMREYITAKAQLFRWQAAEDIAVHYAANEYSSQIAAVSPGAKIPYMQAPGAEVVGEDIVIADQPVCRTDDVRLLGQHNLQNICAAITAVWQVTKNADAMHQVATTFTGLEHRLEFVRELDGVRYYDDSFGTTPETAIVAIEAFKEPKVVILGGSDKGVSFDALAQTVAASNVRSAILIGDTAPAIEQSLRAAGFEAIQPGGMTMPEIVACARAAARPGDVILLSTGCASFGLFKNYKDRGNQFKQVVNDLA